MCPVFFCIITFIPINGLSAPCVNSGTSTFKKQSMWAREHCRISPPRFLAECRKKQLNQVSFVLLCFALFAVSGLCLVFVECLFLVCLLSCIFQRVPTRVWIPGLPFPGRPGIPVIFRSRIPGNENY